MRNCCKHIQLEGHVPGTSGDIFGTFGDIFEHTTVAHINSAIRGLLKRKRPHVHVLPECGILEEEKRNLENHM
jgi:hypothetical protein